MNTEKNSDSRGGSQSKIFARAFWITIGIMFLVTAWLYLSIDFDEQSSLPNVAGSSQSQRASLTRQPYEIQSPVLQRIFADAAVQTVSSINGSPLIDEGVDTMYRPVYLAIDNYLDYHYSVWGSYAELATAGTGSLGNAIETRLFHGFESRTELFLQDIDNEFNSEFQRAVDQGVSEELPSDLSRGDLSSLTSTLIEDTKERMRITAPISGAASVAGAIATNAVAQKIGTQIFAALAVKTGAKLATTGGASFFGVVLSGAAGGSLLGPVGALVGGVGGGIATWFAVDKVFVEVDEYLNRETFKAELVAMIDTSKEETKAQLRAIVEERGSQIQDVTMREFRARQ